MVLLQSGCLCCTMRGDLVDALETLLRDLDNRRCNFRRVLLETTGLADPAPVLHTAMSHPYLLLRYRLDGVVTVVDAVNGEATLDAHVEAVKQAAVADRIVLTKTDLADRSNANGSWPACERSTRQRRSSIQPKARPCPTDFSEAGFTIRTKKFRTSESGLPPRLIPTATTITITTSIGTTTTSVLSSLTAERRDPRRHARDVPGTAAGDAWRQVAAPEGHREARRNARHTGCRARRATCFPSDRAPRLLAR